MGEKWYDDLPDDFFESEEDKAYRRSFEKIRRGLAGGLDFDSACAAIDVEDKELRKQIIDDMLKVLIAEEHFTKKVSLEELAEKLKISRERLESAKTGMLDEVRDTPDVDSYKKFGPENV